MSADVSSPGASPGRSPRQSSEERAKQVGYPDRFDIAVRYQERVFPLETTSELTVQQRLLLYALRQQAREGKNKTPAPSWWNATDRAKWDAWSTLDTMSTFEAMVYFTKTLDEVRPDWLVDQFVYDEEQAATSPQHKAAATAEPAVVAGDAAAELTRAEERAAHAKKQLTPAMTPSLCVRPQPTSSHPISLGSSRDDAATLQSLRRQVDNLQYRLACALRDVQARDDLVAVLRSENAALRQLLTQNGVTPPAQSAAARPLLDALDRAHAARPPPVKSATTQAADSTVQVVAHDDGGRSAEYYQRNQGWFSWLTGGGGGERATNI